MCFAHTHTALYFERCLSIFVSKQLICSLFDDSAAYCNNIIMGLSMTWFSTTLQVHSSALI